MTAHSADADRLLVELVDRLGLTFPEAMRLRTTDVGPAGIRVEDKDGGMRDVPLPQSTRALVESVRAGRRGGYLLDCGGMTSRRARRVLQAA